MGNHNTNISNLQTSYVNDIMQASSTACLASSSADSSGNVVVVNGDVGNVVVANAWNRGANATCAMNNTMNTQLSNIISSAAQNSTNTTTGILGTLLTFQTTFNENNVSQTVMNNITQVMENTCQATAAADSTQNYIVVQSGDSKTSNIIGANASTSQVASNCIMQNASKIVTFNNATSKVTTDTKYTTVGVIFAAILAIGLVVLVAGGAALALWMFFKKPKPAPPADGGELLDPATFAAGGAPSSAPSMSANLGSLLGKFATL